MELAITYIGRLVHHQRHPGPKVLRWNVSREAPLQLAIGSLPLSTSRRASSFDRPSLAKQRLRALGLQYTIRSRIIVLDPAVLAAYRARDRGGQQRATLHVKQQMCDDLNTLFPNRHLTASDFPAHDSGPHLLHSSSDLAADRAYWVVAGLSVTRKNTTAAQSPVVHISRKHVEHRMANRFGACSASNRPVGQINRLATQAGPNIVVVTIALA
ncbi:hypothetical protein PG994_015183 [Apiospora phragmitis]|uniref:Uncharacterized protein n=1 Tax=Apiospora phragmitis TaxID=2905665 RepID=A0ABR1SVQ1_9PEZI